MSYRPTPVLSSLLVLLLAVPVVAQNGPSAERVIRMNGTLSPAAGALAGAPQHVRFAIFDAEAGGALLWEETQALVLDGTGQYSALLGATSPDGLPVDLFAGGAARWLSVSRPGEAAGPRTLLTAVPYAVSAATAGNAASLGGRPVTDFALTPAARRRDADSGVATSTDVYRDPTPLVNNGTAGFIGKFFNTQDLDNSNLFQAGSNIGVGTTTPLDAFHTRFLNTAGSATGYAVQNLGSTAASYSGMLFYDHTGALRQFQGYNNGTGEYRINNISPTGSINFMISSASKFAVANNSNIGLGTTAPQAALHIATRTNLLSDAGATVHASAAAVKFANNPGGGAGDFAYIAQYVKTGEATTLEIGNLNDADDDITMRSSAGRVQFQTTQSAAAGTFSAARTGTRGQASGWIPPGANAEGGIFMEGSNTSTGESGGFYADGNTAAIWSPGDADILRVYDEDNLAPGSTGTPRFLVDNSGNIRVGIGTSGCVRDADLTTIAGTCSSDERLKKDIRPFDSGMLERLLKLQPVYYRWREELLNSDALPKPGEAYGFIAQEVQKIYPEMVTTGPDGYLAVDYGRLQYVLLGALQEEHAKVQAQEARLARLESRLTELEVNAAGATGWGRTLWLLFAGVAAVAMAFLVRATRRRVPAVGAEVAVGQYAQVRS